jgi:IS5 family transposase
MAGPAWPQKIFSLFSIFFLRSYLLIDYIDYVMIGSTTRQASLFYFAFAQEVASLTDELLDPIDELLKDPALIDLAAQALAKRRARSADFGRPSIAPDRLLRCVILKHLKDWSFRQLEKELRTNLLYRRFTRFFEDPIPDYSSFSRTFGLFGKEATAQVHARVIQIAREQSVACGRKLRTDTTAVETHIHHPTDSSLLSDGIRVLTRGLKRISAACQSGALKVVDHQRAAKRRVLEICRAAKTQTDAGRQKLKESYGKLIALTGKLTRQTARVLSELKAGKLAAQADMLLAVLQAEAQLRHFLPLTQKVIAQAQARIFEGENHHPDKILSLFEEHTVVIRKGKAHKPNEFGRLVRIDEVENGLVSCYDIAPNNMADQQQWKPALESHRQIFDRVPHLATADRGFWSAANEALAQELGVKRTVLPGRGRLSRKRAAQQKERWFRRGQGWRAGIEARISTLKHRFGMVRAFYKGEVGFERYVGSCVVAQNLVSIVRHKTLKAKESCRSG